MCNCTILRAPSASRADGVDLEKGLRIGERQSCARKRRLDERAAEMLRAAPEPLDHRQQLRHPGAGVAALVTHDQENRLPKPIFNTFRLRHIDFQTRRIAQPAYFHAALDEIDSRFGSFDAYLAQALGVDQPTRERLTE